MYDGQDVYNSQQITVCWRQAPVNSHMCFTAYPRKYISIPLWIQDKNCGTQKGFEDKHLKSRWRDIPEAGRAHGGKYQLLDTLSLHVARPLVERPDCLHRDGVSTDPELRHIPNMALHCPVQWAVLLTYRPSPGCPGTAEAWPVSPESKGFPLKLLLEKETTFQLAPAKEIPLSILLWE